MFFFTDSASTTTLSQQVIAYSESSGKTKLLEVNGDHHFSNYSWISCQVGPHGLFQQSYISGNFRLLLMNVSYGSFTVEWTRSLDYTIKELCLANFQDRFVFCLGFTKSPYVIHVNTDEEIKLNVMRFCLASNRCQDVPKTHVGRQIASACSLGDNLYVFGGWPGGNPVDKKFVSSIEKLSNPGSVNIMDQVWELIDPPSSEDALVPRPNVGFAPLNSHEIAILGGSISIQARSGVVVT